MLFVVILKKYCLFYKTYIKNLFYKTYIKSITDTIYSLYTGSTVIAE